jgi:hypothetical protein
MITIINNIDQLVFTTETQIGDEYLIIWNEFVF